MAAQAAHGQNRILGNSWAASGYELPSLYRDGAFRADFSGGSFYVVNYPWAMYEINDPGDWWNTKPGNRVRTLR